MLTQRLGCGIQSPVDVGLEGKLSSSGMARPSHSCDMEGAGCVLCYCLGSAAAKRAGPPIPEMPCPPSDLPSAHPEQQG